MKMSRLEAVLVLLFRLVLCVVFIALALGMFVNNIWRGK